MEDTSGNGRTEDKAEEEPTREVDASGGGHEDGAGKRDWHVDVGYPGVGVSLGQAPRDEGRHCAGEEPPQDGVVGSTDAELTGGANESPASVFGGSAQRKGVKRERSRTR